MYRDVQAGADERPADNRWPVRPVQRTLDEYIGNSQARDQQMHQETGNNSADRNMPWGDHNPNEEGLGPRPTETAARRDHMTLEYV